jgi:hypothetical protein
MRVQEVQRIILNLLYLSNELHGSKSPHLLSEAATIAVDINEERGEAVVVVRVGNSCFFAEIGKGAVAVVVK